MAPRIGVSIKSPEVAYPWIQWCWFGKGTVGWRWALLACLSGAISLSGATLSVPDVEGRVGTSLTLPLSLESDSDVFGVQVDIRFDDTRFVGVSPKSAAGLPPEVTVLGSVIGPGHQRVVAYAMRAEPLPDGVLAELSFLIPSDGEAQPSTVELEAQLIAGGDGTPGDAGAVQSGTVSVVIVPSEVSVSGTVRYFSNQAALSGVTVRVSGGEGLESVTDEEGRFELSLPTEVPLSLVAEQFTDAPPNRGVTTLDLLLTRRHILGLNRFETLGQHVAADVDRQGDIGVLDLLLMRRLILGLAESYAEDAPIFRFYPTDGLEEAGLDFISLPFARDYESLVAGQVGQDFLGVKLGDVDGDWRAPELPDGLGTERLSLSPSSATLGLVARAGAGQALRVSVVARAPVGLSSLQFSLEWNAETLRLIPDRSDLGPGVSLSSFGWDGVRDGFLTFAWVDENGSETVWAPEERLFTLEFERIAEFGGNRLAFSPSPTPIFASEGELAVTLLLEPMRIEPSVSLRLVPGVGDRLKPVIRFPTVLGQTFRLESSPTLTGGTWTEVGHWSGNGGIVEAIDWTEAGEQRFYRLWQQQEPTVNRAR